MLAGSVLQFDELPGDGFIALDHGAGEVISRTLVFNRSP